jgi:type I restriction enzyme, R subunit
VPLSESDTRAKLIDPAIHGCGWTADFIRREETAGAMEISDGKPPRGAGGLLGVPGDVAASPITAPPSTCT